MTNHQSSDPVIDEIREVRRRIAQKYGNDTKRLFEHYREVQKRYADRVVDLSGKPQKPVTKSGREED